ncbi:ABC transporter ATP-binding protein [Kribbella sp. NPDC050470]|uniref:ABC transporter ATP-binding protein n=1 Tax=unclassified Kribbella TaxID=2644121 RepID=UPI0037B49AA0
MGTSAERTGLPDTEGISALPADVPAWRVLLSYVRPHRGALLAGGVLSLATAASGLVLPLVVRELIDNLGSDGPVAELVAAMAALVLINAAIGALGSYVLHRTAESVVLEARHHLIGRLLRLRLSAVERHEPGDLMSRVTADTTLLRVVTTDSLVGGVTSVLALAATVVMMGLMDLTLLGVTLLALAVAVVVIGLVVPRIHRAARHAQESVGVMGAALERMFGAFRTVKASGAEDREGDRLRGAASEAWRASVRAGKWEAVAGNTGGLAVQAAFIAVLSVGGARVASGAIEVGTLVAFLLYVYYLMPPVNQLASAVTQYQVGAAAVARIQEAEALPIEQLGPLPRATDQPIPSPPPRLQPTGTTSAPAAVTFDRVSFRYDPELPVVHDEVSFAIPPGGMTAFVGPSGAGKTTVFSLIERFYEPDTGHVLLDGIDVQAWSLTELRAAIGYVEQDAPVLSGTLRENLVFGAPGATAEEVERALRTTRLSAMINALPDGLDTTVGHRGMKLSGGERQRVAIARALLRRPRLLLLDEATSQLDAVNEAALRDTIAEAARTTTVLVVAHRLSTVTLAHRIILMDAGQVRAIGTHRELVTNSPLYAELAATQFLATAG